MFFNKSVLFQNDIAILKLIHDIGSRYRILNKSKGCFNVVVLEALTQQCGSIPVRFDTLKSNLNKLCKCKVFITIIRRYSNSNERYTR